MKIFFSLFLLLVSFNIVLAQNIDRYYCTVKTGDNILANPFTGGINSPQFNKIDLNFNGIKDLVVFDRVGNKLMCFLSDHNNSGQYIFAPEYNSIFPEIENWILLKDYNHDGIEDIFTSSFNGIQVYKAVIVNNQLTFKLLENPYFDQNILSAKYDSGNTFRVVCNNNDIPAIEDIDFDGDLDVLSFTNGTKMSFFKNVCKENNLPLDSFKIIQTDACWGKFAESDTSEEILLSDDPYLCAERTGIENRHSGSTSLVLDIDNDQDYDLLVGDVGYNSLIFLKNGGNKSNAWMTYKERDFPQNDIPVKMNVFLAPFYLDVDNDGKKDLIVAPNAEYDINNPPQNVENVHLYKNIGNGDSIKFKYIRSDFLSGSMLDLGIWSVPVFTDVNGDSLLDIVVGTGPAVGDTGISASKLLYFQNTGTQSKPEFELTDNDYLNVSKLSSKHQVHYFTPAFGDLDGDGDNDLLIGNDDGTLIYYKNIAGKGKTYVFDSPVFEYKNIDVFSYSSPLIYDINNDGLADLLVGCGNDYHTPLQYYGSIVYYQNTGEKNNPDFINDPFTTPNSPYFAKILLSDPTFNISDAHLFVYSDEDDQLLFTGNKYGYINIYRNFSGHVDDSLSPEYEKYGNIDVGSNSAPAVADIDGDGYLEMLLGTKRGGLEFWNTDIKVRKGLSTHNPDPLGKINLYPNPAKDEIIINLDENTEKISDFYIYNTYGTLLIKNKLHSGNNKIKIDKLKNGVYFVKICSKNKFKTIKIIKSN